MIQIIQDDNETNSMSANRILIDIIKHFNACLNPEKHTIPLYKFLEERISKTMSLIHKLINKKETHPNPAKLTPNSESLKVMIFFFKKKHKP